MKKNLLFISVLFSSYGFSQVGVNTSDPKATLDVVASATSPTSIDGLIAPRLTRAELTAKGENLYGENQKGAIVYITDVSGGNFTGQRINIQAVGYYYFDGSVWKNMQIEPWNISNSANPANANNQSIYQNSRVGIGDFTNITMEAGLHIRPNPESYTFAEDNFIIESTNNTTSNDGAITFRRSKFENGVISNVRNGDSLGTIGFAGYANNTFYNRANISTTVTGDVNGTSIPTSLTFSTGITDISERMRISPTGNVGIGTLDPLTKLHVVGNSFTTQNIGLGSKLYFNNENLATPTVYIHKLNSSEPNIESYGAFNIRNPSETTTTHNLRIFDRPNDTTPSFAINKSGVLLLGSGGSSSPDVRISRGGPNWVRFQKTMLTISRDVDDPINSPGLRFSRQDLHSTNNPYANFEIMMSGKLRWGDASSIPDLSLERDSTTKLLKLVGTAYDGAIGVRYLTYDTADKLIKMTSIPPTSPRGEIIDSESREMIDSLNTKITSLEDKIRDLELKIERLIDRQNS